MCLYQQPTRRMAAVLREALKSSEQIALFSGDDVQMQVGRQRHRGRDSPPGVHQQAKRAQGSDHADIHRVPRPAVRPPGDEGLRLAVVRYGGSVLHEGVYGSLAESHAGREDNAPGRSHSPGSPRGDRCSAGYPHVPWHGTPEKAQEVHVRHNVDLSSILPIAFAKLGLVCRLTGQGCNHAEGRLTQRTASIAAASSHPIFA
mmetsp:Transcript_48239/g.97370  ORF Transcript_48239/g.97370 Transcript_48239/m.97370 type:complete len:202 (+) Transcript_48239:48-653(+)